MDTLLLSEAKMKLSEFIENVQSTDMEVVITKKWTTGCRLGKSR